MYRSILVPSSSCSLALLQSGSLWCGLGEGAGLVGEAGAEGRELFGIVEVMGLVGVLIFLGFVGRDMTLRLCCDLLVGDVYASFLLLEGVSSSEESNMEEWLRRVGVCAGDPSAITSSSSMIKTGAQI